MCIICAGGTHADYYDEIAAHIRDHGWHVTGVEAAALRPGWAYTIGLLERYDHPELILTGMCCWPCAHATLNGIGAQVAEGARFTAGDEVESPDGGGRARLGAVHPRQWQTSLFNAWRAYYDAGPLAPAPAALQVVTLDRRGRWQDDPANRRWRHERLDRSPHLARR